MTLIVTSVLEAVAVSAPAPPPAVRVLQLDMDGEGLGAAGEIALQRGGQGGIETADILGVGFAGDDQPPGGLFKRDGGGQAGSIKVQVCQLVALTLAFIIQLL